MKKISLNLIYKKCAICGNDEKKVVFKQPYGSIIGFGKVKYNHKIVVCQKCGLAYVNPMPSDKTMSCYYRNYSVYENSQRNGIESMEDGNKWERSLKIISKRFPKSFRGRVLEIGCATGNGLSHFKSAGWQVYGIDPSPKAAIIAKKLYGIKLITDIFDIRYFEKEKPFDLILLSTVLEHLSAPENLVGKIRKIINESGLIYIEVPNLLKPYVPMGYFMLEHLYYFTPQTLIYFMDNLGFEKDYLHLFDNSPKITPFHPVIIGTFRKRIKKVKTSPKSDYTKALLAIEKYKKSTDKSVEKIQTRINFIISKVKKGRLGIWGCGLHTSQLFSLTKIPMDRLSVIFDSDPKKHGNEINGIKIISKNISRQILKKKVDAIFISSKAFENEIYNQIKHYENYGIKIYKLYG